MKRSSLVTRKCFMHLDLKENNLGPQERKRETWTHRRRENLKDVTTYFNIIRTNKELEHGKHFFLPTGLAAFTPLIVKV